MNISIIKEENNMFVILLDGTTIPVMQATSFRVRKFGQQMKISLYDDDGILIGVFTKAQGVYQIME